MRRVTSGFAARNESTSPELGRGSCRAKIEIERYFVEGVQCR